MEEETDPKVADLLEKIKDAVATSVEQNLFEEEAEAEEVSPVCQTSVSTLAHWSGSSGYVSGTIGIHSINSTYINGYGGGAGAAGWSGYGGTKSLSTYVVSKEENGQTVLDLGDKLPAIIRTSEGDINLSHLKAMMNKLDEVLCAVEKINADNPDFPALASTYRQFRVMEAIARSTPPVDDE